MKEHLFKTDKRKLRIIAIIILAIICVASFVLISNARPTVAKETRIGFAVGKSSSDAPTPKPTTHISDMDGTNEYDVSHTYFGNLKGEGWQYEVYEDIVPDGITGEEHALKMGSTTKYWTRSQTFSPNGYHGYYHYVRARGAIHAMN